VLTLPPYRRDSFIGRGHVVAFLRSAGASSAGCFIHPSRPTSASQVPAGDGWLHEIKHDGYRLMIRKAGDRVRLYTQSGYDWTDRYPAVTGAAAVLKANSAIIDGELVCLKRNGMSCFDTLHSRTKDREAMLFAFDLLELDGDDLKPLPLIERKATLLK
jgi:bifunctional non-homologous end joining protein LigD